MGKKKLFNECQEKFILDNYTKMSNTDLAKKLGMCSRQQVSTWLHNRGILRNGMNFNDKLFTEKDKEFIKNNYQTMSYPEIGKKLGFTSSQIRGKIQNMHLPNKRRDINKHYFDIIDDSLKAYLLGFIFADGWICYNESSGYYEFGMELQSGDKYVLEKINEVLGNQNVIYHRNPREHEILGKKIHIGHMDKLRVYSQDLVLGLMRNGIATQKSQKDTFPIVDDAFFFDFLRGYIDGDGCYYVDNDCTYMHITCASNKPLLFIQNKLKEFDIETRLYTENAKKHRLMCINTTEMKKLVGRLYYKDDLRP